MGNKVLNWMVQKNNMVDVQIREKFGGPKSWGKIDGKARILTLDEQIE